MTVPIQDPLQLKEMPPWMNTCQVPAAPIPSTALQYVGSTIAAARPNLTQSAAL